MPGVAPRALLRRITAADHQRRRWNNGGGWTTDIALDPPDSGDAFRWRVSIADIEQDGPFSSFPGIDRSLLLLAGNGIELDIEDRPGPVHLRRRFAQAGFAGEARVECRLLDGPTRDFNVMTRRGVLVANIEVRSSAGSIDLAGGSEWLVYVAAGQVVATGSSHAVKAATGEALRIDRRDHPDATRIEGAGSLIVVELIPCI